MAITNRLNLGCGPKPAEGWTNFDRCDYPGVDLRGDVRDGLPLPDASMDLVVCMHLLQDLDWLDLPKVLADVRRVLRPGGLLRVGVPDLERAIDAHRRGDAGYFLVPDEDARAIGAKLVTQIIWYGSVRTPFTLDFAEELLLKAGFRDIRRCSFAATCSTRPDAASLDTRERESLFVEATR